MIIASHDIPAYMQALGQAARDAAKTLAQVSTADKNAALHAIAQQLDAHRAAIVAANAKDVAAAQAKGLEPALVDRLKLSDSGINAMIAGLKQVASLPDPVGEMSGFRRLESGIEVGKMRVPLGVIGIIYESRPNVTIDAASLCLKSGNATILRGGSEAFHSNQALAACIEAGLNDAGLPPELIQIVATADRAAVGELITLTQYVDIIVPRGGKSLIERIARDATVPTIKHLDGICHVYIDFAANAQMAIEIADNAKTQRYSPCNTMETLLVHATRVNDVLLPLAEIYAQKGVELRVCPATRAGLAMAGFSGTSQLVPATAEDWSTEYLAPILSIKLVQSLDDAIEHIERYGSHHTDAIITDHHPNAMRFIREVDSASVMVNASTRFADGFEYGLGAEIGISTDKLHARGPVGLEGLTSQKWVVLGTGQVRS